MAKSGGGAERTSQSSERGKVSESGGGGRGRVDDVKLHRGAAWVLNGVWCVNDGQV